MKPRKRDREWFERKVEELGQVIEKLPRERQLELFKELEETDGKDDQQKNLKGGRPLK